MRYSVKTCCYGAQAVLLGSTCMHVQWYLEHMTAANETHHLHACVPNMEDPMRACWATSHTTYPSYEEAWFI